MWIDPCFFYRPVLLCLCFYPSGISACLCLPPVASCHSWNWHKTRHHGQQVFCDQAPPPRRPRHPSTLPPPQLLLPEHTLLFLTLFSSLLVPLLGCRSSHQRVPQLTLPAYSGVWVDVTCTAGLPWAPVKIVPHPPISLPLLCFAVPLGTYHHLRSQGVLSLSACIPPPPPGECELHGGKDLPAWASPYPQLVEQCLEHPRCSMFE